jgi:hypothetical protein
MELLSKEFELNPSGGLASRVGPLRSPLLQSVTAVITSFSSSKRPTSVGRKCRYITRQRQVLCLMFPFHQNKHRALAKADIPTVNGTVSTDMTCRNSEIIKHFPARSHGYS